MHALVMSSGRADSTKLAVESFRRQHPSVDVTVVEGAIRRHDAVVTSNPTHIRRIADATRTKLTVETV